MPAELYCLDDVSLVDFLDASDCPKRDIRRLLDLAAEILGIGIEIMVPSGIDQISVGKGLALYDLLYGLDFSDSADQHGLDRDLWIELMTMRGQLQERQIRGAVAASIATACGAIVRHQAPSMSAAVIVGNDDPNARFALLFTGPNSFGVRPLVLVSDSGAQARIYAIDAIGARAPYARWLIGECNVTEADFFALWDAAFPNLLRSNDLSFRRLHGTFAGLRDDVVKHLSFLNDCFQAILRECNMDFPCVIARSKAGAGIELSNESPNTRKSSKKMRERLATFSNCSVTCELHTKLQPTVNRIHFHPPDAAIAPGKVLIGIFVDHLST